MKFYDTKSSWTSYKNPVLKYENDKFELIMRRAKVWVDKVEITYRSLNESLLYAEMSLTGLNHDDVIKKAIALSENHFTFNFFWGVFEKLVFKSLIRVRFSTIRRQVRENSCIRRVHAWIKYWVYFNFLPHLICNQIFFA